MNTAPSTSNIIAATTEIVSSYVARNVVKTAEMPALIARVHEALTSLGQALPNASIPETLVPAVPIKKSITADYLICLEDGLKFRSMKRHLMTHFSLTPDQYRVRWGLPSDYPMVAPNYAVSRSDIAKQTGLGRRAPTAKANVARSRTRR